MYNSWACFIFLTYISPFPPLHLTNQAASTVHPIITLLSHDWVPWLTLEGAQKHLKTHLENVDSCLCEQLKQMEVQLEEEYEDKQKVLRERRDLEAKLMSAQEQVLHS